MYKPYFIFVGFSLIVICERVNDTSTKYGRNFIGDVSSFVDSIKINVT